MTTPKQLPPLVTNTLMVDLNLVATAGSSTHNEIEAIISQHFNLKEFKGTSTPSLKKLAIVRNILTNLALTQTAGYDYLVFPTGHRNFEKSRYIPSYYTRRLATSVLEAMVATCVIRIVPCEHAFIRIHNTFGGSGTCEIRPATQLQLMISRKFTEVTKETVSSPKAEIIILKSAKVTGNFSEPRVDYSDDSDVGREVWIHRESLDRTNAYLSAHEVTYLGDQRCNKVAINYHRVFNNNSLASGGRYFGHFAQTLPKKDRHLLQIDGQQVSNVDYSALHYNLLRFIDGAFTPMESDPFTIEGYEEFRDEFKALTYILLNSKKSISHPPDDLRQALVDKRWSKSFTEFKEILLNSSTLLTKYQGQGIGLFLMNMESKIMTTAIDSFKLRSAGFIIMHDALLVPSSQARGAAEDMSKAFKAFTGYLPSIKVTQH